MHAMARTLPVLAVATALLFAGCRCSRSDAGGDAGTPASTAALAPAPLGPDELCEKAFGAALEDTLGKCTPEDKQTSEYQRIAGVAGLGAGVCKTIVGGAVAKKRATFDGAKAAACAEALRATLGASRGKRGTTAPPPSCDGVVTGEEGAGEACADDIECQEGLACVGNGSLLDERDGGPRDGVCIGPAAVGAKCARNAESSIGIGGAHPTCAAGAFCDSLEHTCKPAGGAGARCTNDRQCASGLACHLAKCGAAVLQAAGGACLDETDCAEDLFCEGANAFDEPPKPGKCGAKKAAGEACRSAADCKGRCEMGNAGLLGDRGKCVAFCGSG